jgi:DNA-binding HxlR family transcriptional regulator
MRRAWSYGQFCPVAQAAEIIAERWTPLVLRELLLGSRRFNDLQRGVPLMPPATLAQRLRDLQRAKLVERREGEYLLTSGGRALKPIVQALGRWGNQYAQRELGPRDLDPAFLMWDVRRWLVLRMLPRRRVVIFFHFPEAPSGKRSWWIVADRGQVDLCLKPPGYEIDLTVDSDVRTMIEVWRGSLDAREAIRTGRIRFEGARELSRSFVTWMGLSTFAAGGAGPRPARAPVARDSDHPPAATPRAPHRTLL